MIKRFIFKRSMILKPSQVDKSLDFMAIHDRSESEARIKLPDAGFGRIWMCVHVTDYRASIPRQRKPQEELVNESNLTN